MITQHTKFLIFLLFLLIVMTIVYYVFFYKNFVDLTPQQHINISNIRSIYYESRSPNPFRYDHALLSVQRKDQKISHNSYLLDINTGQINAVSRNAQIIIYSEPFNIIMLLEVLPPNKTFGQIFLFEDGPLFPNYDTYIYLYDLNTKTYHFLEQINNYPEGPVALSPDGRYARFTSYRPYKHILIDIKEKKLTYLDTDARWNSGWWTNDILLYQKRDTSDVMLYDIKSTEYTSLITSDELVTFLNQHKRSITNKNLFSVITVWDGDEDQFLLSSNRLITGQDVPPAESWILKINEPDGTLKMFQENFPYNPLAHWNEKLTHFVYSGESNTPDRDSVYLYSLEKNEVTTLYKAAHNNKNSIPAFYQDQILYRKNSNELWVMNINGSNQKKLFPIEK